MSYKEAYQNNHSDFEIIEIIYEDDFDKGELSEEQQEVDNLQAEIDALREKDGNYSASIAQIREEIEEITGRESSGTSISFTYTAPAISTDIAGRFATHEIIGGSTVRQKIGEDPIEVTIDGVCRESTAKQMDTLRDAKYGTLISNRLPGGSLQAQFASISSNPLEDSGAVAITDDTGEFLYTYTISAVEVFV